MPSDLALYEYTSTRATLARVLFVAWREPETHSITPVGRLRILRGDVSDDMKFEFRYLRTAPDVLARPFVSFPAFAATYCSSELFPFFENRMVPAQSPDFPGLATSVGLRDSADPFEVFGASGGLRATDTVEVFPEPAIDAERREATFRFLVRGVRHRPGANDEIDRLRIGDQLHLRPEADNPVDPRAVLVVPDNGIAVGWAPAYLCPALHRSVGTAASGWADVRTIVQHIGNRSGPAHFRLLCEVRFPWPFPEGPFESEAFSLYPA